MNNLLDEYFKRDLTEDEEEQLARWLSSSEEGPQRFIGLMESHYRSMGLPEPEWAEGPLPKFFPKSKNSFLWMLLFIFFAFVLTILAFSNRFWRISGQAPPATASPNLSPMTPSEAATSTSRKKSPAKPAGTRSPQGKIHEELSVVVDNPRSALVTVKVINSDGKEIYLLYAGILPAGQKTFTWNGKTEDGAPSPSGVYYLEVISGAHKLRKEIHLGSKP